MHQIQRPLGHNHSFPNISPSRRPNAHRCDQNRLWFLQLYPRAQLPLGLFSEKMIHRPVGHSYCSPNISPSNRPNVHRCAHNRLWYLQRFDLYPRKQLPLGLFSEMLFHRPVGHYYSYPNISPSHRPNAHRCDTHRLWFLQRFVHGKKLRAAITGSCLNDIHLNCWAMVGGKVVELRIVLASQTLQRAARRKQRAKSNCKLIAAGEKMFGIVSSLKIFACRCTLNCQVRTWSVGKKHHPTTNVCANERLRKPMPRK